MVEYQTGGLYFLDQQFASRIISRTLAAMNLGNFFCSLNSKKRSISLEHWKRNTPTNIRTKCKNSSYFVVGFFFLPKAEYS